MTTRADSAASPDNGKIQQRSRTRKKSVLFPCSICSRSFNKFEHKERHERTHTSNKPYACSECDRRFNRHDSMLRHVRLNHDSESARLLPGSAPQNPNMGEQQFGVGTDCERSTMVPEPSSTSSPSRQTSDTGQNDAEEVQINRLEFTPLQNMVSGRMSYLAHLSSANTRFPADR
ncbi:uncharacterized protein I303_105694 [Kwoniella dejecticola CBS 10117]|uniref:C2H2-type domain-containing protein n=1 Tax=Kwoniella dejecticola CBS 10117 TaxID=1296121 RepID=A0AAJ8KTA1_9TREE